MATFHFPQRQHSFAAPFDANGGAAGRLLGPATGQILLTWQSLIQITAIIIIIIIFIIFTMAAGSGWVYGPAVTCQVDHHHYQYHAGQVQHPQSD